jgi:peptide/nickel transport system substrate-binding protein
LKLLNKIILALSILSAPILIAGENINVAMSSTPTSLVPFYSTDANSQNINRLTHCALVDMNSDMKHECRACSNFSEKFSGDKHVLTFKLKEGLHFSDGTPVGASDVVSSWQYFAKDSIINSSFMGSFESIESVRAIGAGAVEIIFKQFSLENLSNLALLKIIKLKNGVKKNLDFSEVIGCGSYRVESMSPLEIKIVPIEKGHSQMTFKVVKDETTLALKLINKEIDLSVASISPRKMNWLENNSRDLKIYTRPSSNYLFMGLNQTKENLKVPRFREALSLLIPREKLLKYKLKNAAVLARGMFSPAFVEVYEDFPLDKYDPVKSQEIFSELGFHLNKRGFLEKNGKKLSLEWIVSNNKSSIEMAETIKHEFNRAGISIDLNVMEWSSFMNSFKSGRFDLVVSQWIGFSGPDMLKFVFHSKNVPPMGGNRIRYNNSDFDKVIDLASVERQPEKRIALYKKAHRLVMSDRPYISLWHPNIVWIANRCIDNIKLDPIGGFDALLDIVKKNGDNCGK